jgi:hypothetical protein
MMARNASAGVPNTDSAISDIVFVEVVVPTYVDDRRRRPVAAPGVSILPCVLGETAQTVRRHGSDSPRVDAVDESVVAVDDFPKTTAG